MMKNIMLSWSAGIIYDFGRSESKTLLETRGLSVSVGTHTTLSISQNRVSSECYLSDITLMVNHDFH